MKLRQKEFKDGLKYIQVYNENQGIIANVFVDGEIVFKSNVYPLIAGYVLTIAENIHLFIDNVKTEQP